MGDAAEGRRLATVMLLLTALALGGGCRSPIGSMPGYRYFGEPSVDDAWSPKIRGWQDRERRSASDESPASVAHAGKRAPGSENGGDLTLLIDVWDHFNADMNTVVVESSGNFPTQSSTSAIDGGE